MLDVRINSKHYGKNTVLKNIEFKAQTGELIVILAPSGTGKTTLINCLSKRSSFSGIVSTNSKYLNPALVEQHETLDKKETVMESTYYSMRLSNPACKKNDCIYKSRLILESLGLINLSNRKIETLSGGQKRRVQIAQALAQRYDTLILDEPDSGLDVLSSHRLIKDLANIAHGLEKNVLVISHNVNNLSLYDQVLILSKGPDGAASIAYYGKEEYIKFFFQTENILDVFKKIEGGKDSEERYYTELYSGLPRDVKEHLKRLDKEDER